MRPLCHPSRRRGEVFPKTKASETISFSLLFAVFVLKTQLLPLKNYFYRKLNYKAKMENLGTQSLSSLNAVASFQSKIRNNTNKISSAISIQLTLPLCSTAVMSSSCVGRRASNHFSSPSESDSIINSR